MEGSDGSGKTTQIELLYLFLMSSGKDVVVTREPGGTPISEKLREIILDINNADMAYTTEALLYAAARAQIVEQIIRPALNSGKIVICDRFVDSSLVYQGIARGLGIERVEEINSYALNGITPDITFYLDIEPIEGISRKKNQSVLDRIENENSSFHAQIHDGYNKIAKLYPKRIKKIDAMQSKEIIHQQICNILNNYSKGE